MLVYRICISKFADNLNPSGIAGRWNMNGQMVLYASESRALAALEQLANRSGLVFNSIYKIMIINLPDKSNKIRLYNYEKLPSDWRRISGYGKLQGIGSNWYNNSESLILKVPSVLIPQEYNYIINTSHPDFHSNVRLVNTEQFDWDKRFEL